MASQSFERNIASIGSMAYSSKLLFNSKHLTRIIHSGAGKVRSIEDSLGNFILIDLLPGHLTHEEMLSMFAMQRVRTNRAIKPISAPKYVCPLPDK